VKAMVRKLIENPAQDRFLEAHYGRIREARRMSNQRVLNKTRLRTGCHGDFAVTIANEGPAEKRSRRFPRRRLYRHSSFVSPRKRERVAGHASVIGWSEVDEFFVLLASSGEVAPC
jgi:hypothetical protein